MKNAKNITGGIGVGIGVYGIVKEGNSAPTASETLDDFTFMVAIKAGLGDINLANEGILEFSNDNLSVEQASNALNTIHSALTSVFNNFDLSNANDVKAANQYLSENLNSLIKSINAQINNQEEENQNE